MVSTATPIGTRKSINVVVTRARLWLCKDNRREPSAWSEVCSTAGSTNYKGERPGNATQRTIRARIQQAQSTLL
eukprot:2593522-Pleurochrysis_carterae.AAC.1